MRLYRLEICPDLLQQIERNFTKRAAQFASVSAPRVAQTGASGPYWRPSTPNGPFTNVSQVVRFSILLSGLCISYTRAWSYRLLPGYTLLAITLSEFSLTRRVLRVDADIRA